MSEETVTIRIKKRGCGYRKKGGCYIVSEPSDGGQLPLWVDIIPPVPYNGKHFRGAIHIDLEKVLAREEDFLAGTSADRVRKDKSMVTELESFGMPYHKRLATGICKEDGINALTTLEVTSYADLGASLRLLSRTINGKSAAYIALAWRMAQAKRNDLCLANLWRIWNNLSEPSKAKPYVVCALQTAMMCLGADADADELD